MKKTFLLAAAFAITLGSFAQTSQTDAPKTDDQIKVNIERQDFGKIPQGTPVMYSFEIKNITDKPVVIENTWASCGCTTPEKIVDPIMPGKTAALKVQYNAAAAGSFTKDVFIKVAGVEQPKTVQITGEVLTIEAYDAYKKDKKPGIEMPAAKTAPSQLVPARQTAASGTSNQPKLTKD